MRPVAVAAIDGPTFTRLEGHLRLGPTVITDSGVPLTVVPGLHRRARHCTTRCRILPAHSSAGAAPLGFSRQAALSEESLLARGKDERGTTVHTDEVFINGAGGVHGAAPSCLGTAV
jgi:hypothetical protein